MQNRLERAPKITVLRHTKEVNSVRIVFVTRVRASRDVPTIHIPSIEFVVNITIKFNMPVEF